MPAAGLGAQCVNPQVVPDQTTSSGSATFSDNTALEATGVTINGGASVSFVAGNCIHLGAGFRATAGTAATTFHAWVEAAPAVISASPATGSGASQTFTWTVASASGEGNIAHVFALFNTSLTGVNGCYISYNRGANALYLADNAGASWLGGFAPGSASNSQCGIAGSGTAVNASGNQLTLTVPVTFQAGFAGVKNDYLNVYNSEGLSAGWQQMGTWSVPVGQQYYLTTGVSPAGGGTIAPGSGWYASGAQVQVTATAAQGYAFAGFSGDLAGTANPQTVTMNGTKSVVGNFVAAAVQHVITSNPAGLAVTVDGAGCTTPCTYSWVPGSNHTVVAAFRQQSSGTTHYFSYLGGAGSRQAEQVWSDAGALSNPITAQSSPTTNTAYFYSDALVTLRTCLDKDLSASSNCVLAQGIHPVTSPIRVERQKVTIRGESSDRKTTRLRRSASHTDEMMVVNVAGTAEGITIQNQTFCGESARSTPFNGCPAPPPLGAQTTCGEWQGYIDSHIKTGTPTKKYLEDNKIQLCTDLMISGAYTGRTTDLAELWTSTTPSQLTYTGPYSVTISNAAFEGATGHAVALYASSDRRVEDIYITGSAINRSEVTGLLVGVNGEDYGDHRACNYPTFMNDSTRHVPRNIRVEGNKSVGPAQQQDENANGFRSNRTGAMGINAARWFALRNNTFLNNYYAPGGGNECGGTFFFDQCADTVQIYQNDLTGPMWSCTGGMELWGRNIEVGAGAQGNEAKNYTGEGIGLNSVMNATIRSNTTTNNGSGGIWDATREPGDACAPVPRETDHVTIQGNTSGQQSYGVKVADREHSTNIVSTVSIDGSGTPYLDPYVTLTGRTSITPTPEPVGPTSEQRDPRALPVIALQDLSTPIRPVAAKCPAADPYVPGSSPAREVFSFPASDVLGDANIQSHEVVFSLVGPDQSEQKSGAQGCQFIFTPPGDLSECSNPDGTSRGCGELVLANNDGIYDGPNPSVVGPGGTELANSYCRIRTGSGESKVVAEGKVLKLTLDVELLNSTMKYIYTKTLNRQGLYSNGGLWRYWGYW